MNLFKSFSLLTCSFCSLFLVQKRIFCLTNQNTIDRLKKKKECEISTYTPYVLETHYNVKIITYTYMSQYSYFLLMSWYCPSGKFWSNMTNSLLKTKKCEKKFLVFLETLKFNCIILYQTLLYIDASMQRLKQSVKEWENVYLVNVSMQGLAK